MLANDAGRNREGGRGRRCREQLHRPFYSRQSSQFRPCFGGRGDAARDAQRAPAGGRPARPPARGRRNLRPGHADRRSRGRRRAQSPEGASSRQPRSARARPARAPSASARATSASISAAACASASPARVSASSVVVSARRRSSSARQISSSASVADSCLVLGLELRPRARRASVERGGDRRPARRGPPSRRCGSPSARAQRRAALPWSPGGGPSSTVTLAVRRSSQKRAGGGRSERPGPSRRRAATPGRRRVGRRGRCEALRVATVVGRRASGAAPDRDRAGRRRR